MSRSQSPASAAARKRVAGAGSASGTKYSVLLPTYNERENLPLIVAMLDKVFVEKCVPRARGCRAGARRGAVGHAAAAGQHAGV